MAGGAANPKEIESPPTTITTPELSVVVSPDGSRPPPVVGGVADPKEIESPPTTITTPELDLPAARTSPFPSTSMAPPDETVPSSQVNNLDMFKDDGIDLEDLMVAECSNMTQAMRKHITSPFSDSQTQYEKDMLVAAVLGSQEATPFSALSQADTSSYASELANLLPSSTDEEQPILEEDVQKEGDVEENGEVQEEEKPVEEGQPQALSVTMFYRKKSPPPTVDQLSLQVDRTLNILDENIFLESTSDLTPISAPPTQIHAAKPHHLAVSPEIHGLSSPLGLEPITSMHIPDNCAPLKTPTKEVDVTSSQMSGSSDPGTSQSTPKATPSISQEALEELTPVTKKLQESLPVMIRPETPL